MENDIDRILGRESFEYGNHRIKVAVSLTRTKDKWCTNAPTRRERVYARRVEVAAFHNCDKEVSNYMYVSLEEGSSGPGVTAYLRALLSDRSATEIHASGSNPIPPIHEQIEATARPVFEELDELYNYTKYDYEIGVTVGIDRVKHETSWVEVEDEIDRISTELDAIVDDTARQEHTTNSE